LIPKRINFGGGLGIPYFSNESELDLNQFTHCMNAELNHCNHIFSHPIEYILELGRFIVGPFGYYLSSVMSVKKSRDRKFVILDGGMHQNMPASGNFGQIIKRNYQIENISNRNGPKETVDIVGCLCTTLDRLATGVEIPTPEVGHVIAFENSGAYGLTASPLLFLGHATPREILVRNGETKVIRESRDISYFN
jgi:diaminopimelate decarboxylase